MHDEPILNAQLFSPAFVQAYKCDFDKGKPYRHLVIDQFLDPDFALRIRQGFPSLDSMKTHYTGINEKKAEDNNFGRLDSAFTELHAQLSSPAFLHWLAELTGIDPLTVVDDRLGFGLHQGGDKSFLDIHIDYNLHPVAKMQRRLNFLLFFNEEWQESWGGLLELWDPRTKKTGRYIAPVFNRTVIFECSEISYHGYTRIHVPPGITRKSYYQYYFSAPSKDLFYHDTIFKPVPEDPLIKKISVPVKEFLKNTVKKSLLRLGLERYLK